MIPRISFITAIAGAALLLAVPAAWGDSWGADRQQPVDFWNYDQQGKQIANSSPGVAPDRLAKLYTGLTTESSAPIGSPDLADRAAAAKQNHVAAMLDARERGLTTSRSDQSNEVGVRFDSALQEARPYGPGIEEPGLVATTVVDDRFKIDPITSPVPDSAASSGGELEWPQVGIGFAMGIVLMLGLYLAMKAARQRPLAH